MQLLIDIALSLIYFLAFLMVCAWTWRFWKMYVNQKHLNGIDWVMLEIKMPRELVKSPFATEIAISALLQGGGISQWWHREFKGSLPAYGSLEIASIEGVVHFYVRVKRQFKSLIESNFYAQYPGIEIVEADDYTKMIRYHHLSKDVSLWGSSFKLGKEYQVWDEEKGEKAKKDGKDYKMKADFLPLKTYVDYGLDKNPDEEYKIDPMASLIEFMGSIGKGEYFWYQIIVSTEAVYDDKKFSKFFVNEVSHKHLSLSDMADQFKKWVRLTGYTPAGKALKEEIAIDEEGKPYMKKVLTTNPVANTKKEMDLTVEDKANIEAVNKKLSKPIALATIRLLYITDNTKAKFNGQQIQNILSYPKPYEGANKLNPNTTTDPYDYQWQNWRGRRVPWRSEEFFEAFVEREAFYPHIPERKWLDKEEDGFFWHSTMKSRKVWRMLFEGFFHPFSHPHPGEVMALNLEEIATLWHLPSTAIMTPTLPRIDSTKSVAPVNLPQ